jgi:hypothetical protein
LGEHTSLLSVKQDLALKVPNELLREIGQELAGGSKIQIV